MSSPSATLSTTLIGPLAGLKVLEFANAKTDMCGRILADLGADVVLVESAEGSQSRRKAPLIGDQSLFFASHAANKSSLILNLQQEADRQRLREILPATDIVIASDCPDTLTAHGLSAATLHQINPQLVILAISDFGQTGPYRDLQANDAVLMAMAGMLCRSGQPGREPLLPPGEMAYASSAVQAAWVVLVSYWQRLSIGVGDYLDFSLFEGTAQILDPIMGVTGSAAAGKSAMQLANSRGRPAAGHLYPIFPCTDGHVRMFMLNPRQWQAMSEWLGPDHAFTDPTYANLFNRLKVIDDIIALIAAMTRSMSTEQVLLEGQKRGIPVAVLASPEAVLNDEHFNARGAFCELPLANGQTAKVPSGYLEIDGQRAGIRQPAPALGERGATQIQHWRKTRTPADADSYTRGASQRPLAGIRILDLGVIVAGAELGRILADQGAEVIKVENQAFPDGSRQSGTKDLVSFSFAQGHRGKQSLGLNLRSPEGVEIFKQLAAHSDIILSNFKPGTLDSLGIGYDAIKQVNPRIIMADSSALGNTGPLSRTLGYGPLVRASCGLTGLWRYPDDASSFSDGITILPDHLAARVSAIGVMALLIRRQQTGVGGTVSVSQAETILATFTSQYLRESAQPGSLQPQGNNLEFSAPAGLFACAGEDEWCVIAVEDDTSWQRLCQVIERPDLAAASDLANVSGRLAQRDRVDAAVQAWSSQQAPEVVMDRLQSAGVVAGRMYRMDEFETNPHLLARDFMTRIHQPGHEESWPTENAPVRSQNLPDPDIRPAPKQAEHTREVMQRVMQMSPAQIEALIDRKVLEI